MTIGVIFIVVFIGGQEKILYIPSKLMSINYNNYLSNNDIEYKENCFAWLKSGVFNSQLTVVNDEGKFKYFNGIRSPFQIYGNRVVFVKNNRLLLRDMEKRKDFEIANHVDRFIVYNDSVFYLSQSKLDDAIDCWENQLYIYNFPKGESRLICENVTQFYIHQEELFAVNSDDFLVKISFDDYSVREIIKLEIKQYPFTVMPQGDNLLIYHRANKLDVLNLNTNSTKSISMSDSQYANNQIRFICDDDNIFFSFQATKTNGSIVTNVDDKNNGVWRVNPQTLEKERISSETFECLYLFENSLLFGVKNDAVYKIDTQAKQVTKIIG